MWMVFFFFFFLASAAFLPLTFFTVTFFLEAGFGFDFVLGLTLILLFFLAGVGGAFFGLGSLRGTLPM